MVRLTRTRAWLEQLLHTHDTPSRTAFAYALGVFIGFSPLLGLHTILGVLLAFSLNLNRVAVLLGVYTNLPWIVVPYYTLATWLGAALLQLDVPAGTAERLIDAVEQRSWARLRAAAGDLRPLVWAFAVGSTLGAGLLSLVAYRTAYFAVLAHRRSKSASQHPDS